MTPPTDELAPIAKLALGGQALLLLVGLALIWRLCFSAKSHPLWQKPSPLPLWRVPLVDFLIAAFTVIAGGVAGQFSAQMILNGFALDSDAKLVVLGAAFQSGLLIGALIAAVMTRKIVANQLATAAAVALLESDATAAPPIAPPTTPTPTPQSVRRVFQAGALTLLAAMPLLAGLNLGWTAMLDRLGFETDKQPLVDLFAESNSTPILVVMAVLAVVVAPIAEEVIFRAGLFRYLHLRMPRWAAYVLPATIFAVLHGNLVAFVPLSALGIIFSVAYERTGDIRVPIVAHALFNLNTILMLLAGVDV